jgi:hypothetical protein
MIRWLAETHPQDETTAAAFVNMDRGDQGKQ